ncbi:MULTISPECIES: phosphonate ABC transporter ATP-binding protein [unclassified Haladaptatus]|uniref:phosphonate ABC transporter ATP-binding protein n=1 Tax=unclassified Haladaptatus TaxID=2622732 RepID=UPI00209BDC45|nr:MULTISPECIES: phosphonate ABC transporter ATP-binding protein [unclassified Haladaptatus]MCO8242825.1 phosphonate ABC transporter ATP-binding protein [Haladaptatus sp. AB643]MCO8252585.1 phosphonate ABC transporter ATP-binding protein [Haladaptatus sp. AB618]
MASLTVSDITKVYGGETVALDDVSFEIPDGEFVILLGPSGAGKSTLLRLLNGLERPTEGEIRIGDDRVSGTRSDVAMVFQMHYLVESMSAYRNALTGALNRTDTVDSVFTRYDEEDKEMALRSLETVGLLEEANQRADSMSGGQQQRVGIARALTQDPQLLLADEPVASLDPKAAQDVMHYMKRAAEERNLTSIVSLHQVNIAREFGERFIGLRDGNVVFDGSKDDLTMEDVDRIYYGESPEDSAINNIA